MAEEIEIINVGGDGVASEATLKSLSDAVKALAKSTGKDPRSEEAKLLKLANEARKSGIEIIKDQNDAMEELTSSAEHASKQMQNMNRGIGNLILNGIGSVLGSAVNLGKELAFGGDRMTDFAKHIPIVGEHLAVLTQFVDDNIDSFRQLAGVGIDFGESIFEVRRQTAIAGISLEAFQNVVANNSEVLAQFGGNAERGARAFAQVSGGVQANLGPQLSRLGITMEEAGEMTASYLNIQTRVGRAQNMTQAQLSAGAGEYVLQLDRLSKITGKSREALAAELEQNAISPAMNILYSSLADGGAEIQGTLQVLKDKVGPEAAEALETLIARNGVPIMGTLSQGLAQLNPEIMTLAQGLRDGSMDMEDAVRIMGNTQAMAAQRARDEGDILTVLAENGNVQALAVSSMIGFNTATDDLTAAAENQQNAMNDQSRGLLDFERQVANVRNEFNRSFVENGLFSGLQEALSSGLSGGLATALASGAVIAAIAGVFAAKAITSRVADMLGGGRESRRGGRTGGGLGRAAGGGIAGLGRGIGAGISGLGNGLAAAGMKAPAIALGGLAIGGAILAIGAGVAGATWLMGEALPNLAEGLESFSDLDGNNLKRVAVGLGAMSLALGVFGAGTAIASVGNTISNIIDSLPGKSPLEKLIEFGNAPVNSTAVESNAKALKAFGEAMAGINLGSGALDNLLANLFDGITSFFGGDTTLPMQKIKEFGAVTLPTQAIQNNALAVKAFADAMSGLGSVGGDAFSNLLANVFDGIVTVFGGEKTYPWDKVTAFANENINAAGIRTNSEAIAAFATAMESIPNVPTERTGGIFGSIIDAFAGEVVLPWDKVREFGATDLDPTGFVIKNAQSLAGFATAMNSFQGAGQIDTERAGGLFGLVAYAFAGETQFPWDAVREFGATELDPNGNVMANAEAMAAFANGLAGFRDSEISNVVIPNVTLLTEGISTLNSAFDSENIDDYEDALDNLRDTLEGLNETIRENNALNGASASSAGGAGGGSGGSGGGSSESNRALIQLLTQLNTTMTEMAEELDGHNDLQSKINRNIKSLSGTL